MHCYFLAVVFLVDSCGEQEIQVLVCSSGGSPLMWRKLSLFVHSVGLICVIKPTDPGSAARAIFYIFVVVAKLQCWGFFFEGGGKSCSVVALCFPSLKLLQNM